MFKKFGEAFEITESNLHTEESALFDQEINEKFSKFASDLKRLAPKAKDFLYFSAIMMHAAEASLFDQNGKFKLNSKGEKVSAHWEKKGESWKWITNDPTIKPYKNCFLPGTKILMADGSIKNIEEIQSGDKVFTHKNRIRKVLRTFITPHDGSVVRLDVKNNEPVYCTDNHPIFNVDLPEQEKGLKSLTRISKDPSFELKYKLSKASELSEGNLLLSPVITHKINSNLNPNRARLLGIYAAEGSFGKKYGKLQSVKFTVGITETKQAELIKNIFTEEFPECSVQINSEPTRSIIEITATGSEIPYWFSHHVGEYSHDKKISSELCFSSDEIKKEFLAGLLDGDGCKADYNKIILITTSSNLAYQVKMMLNSMEISNSVKKNSAKNRVMKWKNREYKCRDSYRITIAGNGYKKLELDRKTVKYNFQDIVYKKISNFKDSNCIHNINAITTENYKGNVYNFEVEEDHSYIANGIKVSNCNGDIFPEEELIKAHKKWVGKPLCIDHKSSSVDFIRGVIVDTYYDRSLRRVVALCALDKVNYPDLARKVSSGYATSVSMGTAVGKAICTDCGAAARTEKDFCQHMRTKSGYGEINVDLQPIELSIVVNGADPQAKIKHIIASANHLNSYAESKEQEVSQEADLIGKAVEDIKSRLDALVNDFEEESKNLDKSEDEGSEDESTSEDSHDSNFSMDINNAEDKVGEDEPKNESVEVEKAASDDNGAFKNEFFDLKASIEDKLAKLQEDFNKLSIQLNEESRNVIMDKKGYFQGAGGVNEPTPGKTKYEIDPMNEKLRTSGDKQMEGQMDTGPVDGMAPGPQSAGVSEIERKKMLSRASEERAARRASALSDAKKNLEKRSYFQGGEEEPTPGKPQYKADDLNEKTRVKEDKQMTGQAPFPNTGAVDGLHPTPESAVKEMGAPKDELKRKELLQRASLKARFVKAATSSGAEDLGNSTWQVLADDKLVLTASVSQLSGGRVDALYSTIATKDFGKKMLEKVKSVGIDKATALYTKAQDMGMPVAPAMPEMSAAPAAEAPMADAPAANAGAADGDVGETAKSLVSELKETVSDLGEAVEALVAERGDMAAPTGEMSAVASSLHKMRRELNSSLTEGLKKSASDLSDHAEELQLIGNIFDGSNVTATNREYVESIALDAIAEAKAALAESMTLIGNFVKYAKGTEAMLKTAGIEKALSKKAELGLDLESDLGEMLEQDALEHEAPDAECTCPVHGDMHAAEEMESADEMMADDMMADDMMADDMMGDSNDATIEVKPADVAKLDTTHLAPTDKVQVTASFDLSTREGRTAYRTKLAAETLTDSDALTEAHPGGGVTTKLDVKPEGDLAKVETREEVAEAMMDLANAPPKVRKEAEGIHKLVLAGRLSKNDIDLLVAHGADAAAVAYYKKFFGQVDGGSEFAAELLKEHAKASSDEEMASYKVKMARAYQLAYDMVARGLCASEQTVVASQVEEIMKYNDEAFESLKRVVAKHPISGLKKEAGRMPVVGLLEEGDSKPAASSDLYSALTTAFSNRKY